ncbi:MAG TPA: hypothetical protein VFS44_11085 [Gemmatimonadaceae bacterium]|nr:hypothetical protein [Gemmatimonadaceae bacterium]
MHTSPTSTRRTTTTLALLGAATLAACGDPMTPMAPPDESAAHSRAASALGLSDGDYVAELHPLNAAVQNALDPERADGPLGVARGKAFFTIRNGQFSARVDARGLEPNMPHAQHIHTATRCPPAAADVNGDGIVDVIEGVPFYGPILIPLDDNLAVQGAGAFPVATGRQGSIQYQASVALNTLLADLDAPDPDPTDAIVKLNGAPLALETRHVVLHGVDIHTFLPPSVATLGTAPPQATLPVACGPVRKID